MILLKEFDDQIGEAFVDHVRSVNTARRIQIVLMRQTTDYVILRTESTRELNAAITPATISKPDPPVERVVFLGSKQKAVENRECGRIIRTAVEKTGFKPAENWTCYLKDKLCLRCPRCLLFGAVSVEGGVRGVSNYLARVKYGSAFSVQPREDAEEVHTFNAVDELTKRTGQALGERISVKPGIIFPSIVTMESVTEWEFILLVKSILSSKRYGAETRICGSIQNDIVSLALGQEEIISPLELTLELADTETTGSEVKRILETYRKKAISPNNIKIIDFADTTSIIERIKSIEIDENFLKNSFKDVESVMKEIESK